MKEIPILFSGPMVRAILEGRKTQTRRVCKLQDVNGKSFYEYSEDAKASLVRSCPYGQPGDRLWVRETWSKEGLHPDECYYHATPYGLTSSEVEKIKWKPSIHMRRIDSRITLEITGVRVERLNDITQADALEEGVTMQMLSNFGYATEESEESFNYTQAKKTFRLLWESINGAGSWQQNPWVWVIEFKKV